MLLPEIMFWFFQCLCIVLRTLTCTDRNSAEVCNCILCGLLLYDILPCVCSCIASRLSSLYSTKHRESTALPRFPPPCSWTGDLVGRKMRLLLGSSCSIRDHGFCCLMFSVLKNISYVLSSPGAQLFQEGG